MKTYILNAAGGSEELKMVQVAIPTPTAQEVLISVKALSINPVDIKTRMGKGIYGRLKDFSPLVLGWDISGVVEAVGEGVTDFTVGDEVFGMVNFPAHGQAYAEYVVAPAAHLTKKPSNISHQEAAAACLAALTAYQILHRHIRHDDKLLVHAAAGGVGHFVVQIAKILGAYVIGTASAKNIDFVKSLGADEVIDYTQTDFTKAVQNLDFVFDTMAGETLEKSIQVVKKGGKIISIPSGIPQNIVDLGKMKEVSVAFELVQSNGEDMQQIADWLATGQLKAVVSHDFAFEEMAQAHQQMETGRTKGKIVVSI
jgi:NADPH:quinone reductase-like Zn-dependent oxidoreductase